ncbi:DNA sulfur modification protein DndE [Polynucleobacter paneuropaeus]|jgi:DNA sulfur modification protein DndE|nr:DNA sulfur modification protein DndE [Polynucleobacter paneuropaeus]
MIDNVRISEKAKNQLITLKRRTGIQNWNVLCRWAFCLSLREPTAPPNENIVTDSAVEMTWRTFTGGDEALYLALLIEKARVDKVSIDKVELNHYFKLHLHRGISYLNSAPTDSIENYIKLAV